MGIKESTEEKRFKIKTNSNSFSLSHWFSLLLSRDFDLKFKSIIENYSESYDQYFVIAIQQKMKNVS